MSPKGDACWYITVTSSPGIFGFQGFFLSSLDYGNGDKVQYTYDQQGRQLASLTEGATTWNYTYNSAGLRTGRTDGTTNYTYVYDGSRLMYAQKGDVQMRMSYDTTGPLSLIYNGATYRYEVNIQGDVIALLDTEGNVVVEYTYDAWGNPLTITGELADTVGVNNPLRYRGYVYDTETQLYYLQSRYYDPELGRFLNADAFISTGQGLSGHNVFIYCGNSPVNRIDATGHFWGLIVPIIQTIDDIKNLTNSESDNVVTSSYTPNKESVCINNSDKIKTPWVQFGYSFYLNHFSEYSDYFKGSTVAMSEEWILHNVGSVGFGLMGDILDFLGKDGEKMQHYSNRCANVDIGPTIYHDDPASHGAFSRIMKGVYFFTSPGTAIIDLIVYWGSKGD